VVDVYHGEAVADPYRWLEDSDAPESVAWIEAQAKLADTFLSAVPSRENIRRRLQALWNYPRPGVPFERGGQWFQWHQEGLENQPKLWVSPSPESRRRVLLDPNQLSADGTVAVSTAEVTADGSLLAYATSDAGSDWQTWHVRQVQTGADTGDAVHWSKFSTAAWRQDNSGFYYLAVAPPAAGEELTGENREQKVMFHRLGSAQGNDELVYWAPEQPDWMPRATVTEDGRYLVLTIERNLFPENQLWVIDLAAPAPALRPLADDFSCQVAVVGNTGSTFLLMTDFGAPRRRLVAAELEGGPDRDRWRQVVGEGPDTLISAHLFGGRLVCHYLHDARSRLTVHGLDGRPVGEIELPEGASIGADHAEREGIEGRVSSPVMHMAVTSFAESGAVWSHHLDTGETRLVEPSGAAFDADAIVTERVRATSADGTEVPMFLAHRRDVTADGDVPVLLYGYGGFDIPLTPGFSVRHAAWMQMGGLVAVANLRGGGEFGREWYDAGRLAHKQNVFDDFCACARWLAQSGWSRPERIAINGGSNGGLLVGACLTQRPELFGAAVAEVGVLDMLRFHKFTIGWAWTSDFGNPNDPEQYRWLRAYSPLHNVSPRRYPPTLIMTGDHDDRVVPGHSFKFAATLQAAQQGDAPILVRIDTDAGHGAGKPTAKLVESTADLLAFLDATVGWSASR
jgi:prolyl oligopeptidase